MQELRANTAVKAVIGPFVAVGDAFTPVTTVGDPGTDLDGVDEGYLLKHDNGTAVDLTSGGVGILWAALANADGYYHLSLSATETETPGMLTVLVQDDDVCLPVRNDFMVLSEFEWDRKYSLEGAGSGALSGVLHYGTFAAATSTGATLAANTFANDEITGAIVHVTSGTGAGQTRFVTAFTAADEKIVVDTWETTPTGAVYAIFAAPPSNATNLPAVNATQISGDSTAADNLELFTEVLENGTGLIDDGTFKADALAAATFATGAFTADAFAANAIIAGTLATGAINANAFAADAIVAATLATDAITTDALADGTITAAKLGADCITNAKIADDALAAEQFAAFTEAYSTDGGTKTLPQALYEICSMLQEKSVSGTTVTVKKVDGSTSAMTFTLDSATDPTSITRAS